MKKPERYIGPIGTSVPDGYIDCTNPVQGGRVGIPVLRHHPYYALRKKVVVAVSGRVGFGVDVEALVDAIMEAL